MKMEGLILDNADIIQETKTKFGTGEQITVGKLNLITTNPTQSVVVNISADMWANGAAGEHLKQLVGKRTMFDIQYKETKFGNDEGRHVEINGFHLFALPPVQGK